MHTNFSDGVNSIEEMSIACKKSGLKYIAITDHVGQLSIAGAMSPKQIKKQRKEICIYCRYASLHKERTL